MMMAENTSEFGKGASMIMTSLHTSYADTGGNIGYWHTGLNPERVQGYDPRLPLPGTGQAEWTALSAQCPCHQSTEGVCNRLNNKASPDTRNPDGQNPDYMFGRYHRALWLKRSLSGRSGLIGRLTKTS